MRAASVGSSLGSQGVSGKKWNATRFLEILLHSYLEHIFYLKSRREGRMDRIDVALIGAGRMGQVHGPNAARTPGLRLRYVVDPRPDVAAAMSAATGAETATLEQ